MTDQADMEALTRARELGILDRVLTDAENAIYDAGMAAAYARAAEDLRQSIKRRADLYRQKQKRHDPLAEDTATEWDKVEHTIEAFDWLLSDFAAIEALGEAKG